MNNSFGKGFHKLKAHMLNRLMTGRCPRKSLQLRPKVIRFSSTSLNPYEGTFVSSEICHLNLLNGVCHRCCGEFNLKKDSSSHQYFITQGMGSSTFITFSTENFSGGEFGLWVEWGEGEEESQGYTPVY